MFAIVVLRRIQIYLHSPDFHSKYRRIQAISTLARDLSSPTEWDAAVIAFVAGFLPRVGLNSKIESNAYTDAAGRESRPGSKLGNTTGQTSSKKLLDTGRLYLILTMQYRNIVDSLSSNELW